MPQVIIISNRLPVSVKKEKGKLTFYPSAGGLATGLSSYSRNKHNKWIGWPGIVSDELTEEDKQQITDKLAVDNCYPVFLSQKQLDDYYNGYSNSILWPFFHNLETDFSQMDKRWKAYRSVNKHFTEVALALSEPRSTIWVHDYQLMLVPEMLRQERPHDNIGFFLHIPFPSEQTFNTLPHAKNLLNGVLGADLAGFHTTTYVNNFLQSCNDLHVGLPGPKQVILPERVVRVTDFPIGIDYNKYAQARNHTDVQKEVRKLKRKFGRYKVILTVDRLDPTKGLVERLEAYREFLRRNPLLHRKVVMIMQAAPSRTDVEAYRKLKEDVERLVASTNKTYGTPNWKPIHYYYTSAPFERVAALYQIADVAFIAPLKDGMNLVAKEYVASKTNKSGTLILSETAGAAQELSDAIIVDPSKRIALVNALTRAVSMRPKEIKTQLTAMQDKISSNTIQSWANTFMKSLQQAPRGAPRRTKRLTESVYRNMKQTFKLASRRLILLDYDGVLSAFTETPSQAKPPANVMSLLKKLAQNDKNDVVIISGRSQSNMEEWFGSLAVGLAAEHGALVRLRGRDWHRVGQQSLEWKKIIRPVLERYAKRTPGAFVEEKETSLVWHFRQASPYFAQKNAVILKKALKPVVKQFGINLNSGNMILELKSPEANKGRVLTHWLANSPEFVLAIGDDFTDEDMFSALPVEAYTVKVGRGKTSASFRLKNVSEVLHLLKRLA